MQELRTWVQSFDAPNVVEEMVYARVLFAFSDIEPVFEITVDDLSTIQDNNGTWYCDVLATAKYIDLKDKQETQVTRRISEPVFHNYFCYKVPFNDEYSVIVYIPPVFAHELHTMAGIAQIKMSPNPEQFCHQLQLEYGYAWLVVRN